MVDRVRAKGPYGFETEFEIRARTANNANFGEQQQEPQHGLVRIGCTLAAHPESLRCGLVMGDFLFFSSDN